MKKGKNLILVIAVILSSCAPTTFYQLYKTESNNVETEENGLTYENDDIQVIYNFWDVYGNSSFLIINKTDSNVFIDLKKSHLIINGIAKTYFQNRTYSETSSSSRSVGSYSSSSYLNKSSTSFSNAYYIDGFGNVNSQGYTTGSISTSSSKSKITTAKGFAISYIEKDVICVPANYAKIFNGFSLNTDIYRDCDLFRYPSSKSIKSKKFDSETSPLSITNIISYGFDESNLKKFKEIESNFWVSEITNYPSTEFYERKYPEYCGEKSQYSKNYYLFNKPNRFYIKYSNGTTTGLEH